jgi:hypothetical protein
MQLPAQHGWQQPLCCSRCPATCCWSTRCRYPSSTVLRRAVFCNSRDISYVDYIAVGKGRDMGFETINTFEAKVTGGAQGSAGAGGWGLQLLTRGPTG